MASLSDATGDQRDDICELFDSVVAYGLPPCDFCFRQPPAERPTPSGFFNRTVMKAVNLEGDTPSTRKGPTLCDEHSDEWDTCAPDATHLVDVTLEEYEAHPVRNAWTYTVDSIESVQ
jgi:hypothetical protein